MREGQQKSSLFQVGLGTFLVLPWVNTYTAGPSPETWPMLITVFCAAILCIFKKKINIDMLIAAWIIAATINSTTGLLQYFVLADGIPGIIQPAPGNAFANLGQRNQFATLTSIGLLALIGWLAQQSAESKISWWVKYLAILFAFGNASSGSRTGLLQWILIFLMTVFWSIPHRPRLTLLVLQSLLAYFTAGVMLPYLLNVITGTSGESLWNRFAETANCESRIVLWSNVISMIVQKPWLGWGWNELKYAHFVTSFEDTRFCAMLGNAHNLPLHLAITLGIPAAILICGGFLYWICTQRPWREENSTRQMAWGILGVILLHSLVEYPLWYGPFQMAFGLCLWTLIKPVESKIHSEFSKCIFFKDKLPFIVATILIAGCCWISFDYRRATYLYQMAVRRSDTSHNYKPIQLIKLTFFSDQIDFISLVLTPLLVSNAQWTYETTSTLLHYSPEPAVIEKFIESSVLIGQYGEAREKLRLYRAAYPTASARWTKFHAEDVKALQKVE